MSALRAVSGRPISTDRREAWGLGLESTEMRRATRSTVKLAPADASAIAMSCSTSAGAAVTHGNPIVIEFVKKISANDSPTTA